VSSLPKTVIRQRRDCDLNPGPSAPESSMLTTRLPSHHRVGFFFVPGTKVNDVCLRISGESAHGPASKMLCESARE